MGKPRSLRRIGFILPLVFLGALPWPGHAKHPSDPDGLPSSDPKHEWVILTGDPCVTTLPYALRDVIAAAVRQFGRDHWQIFDQDDREVVTMWKSMHHPLVRIFMGSIHARCTVTLASLGPGQTRMTFEGDLASHHDLHHNPMLGAAEHEYTKGAERYAEEVRGDLDSHGRYSAR